MSNESPGRCITNQQGYGNIIKTAKQALKVKKQAK